MGCVCVCVCIFCIACSVLAQILAAVYWLISWTFTLSLLGNPSAAPKCVFDVDTVGEHCSVSDEVVSQEWGFLAALVIWMCSLPGGWTLLVTVVLAQLYVASCCVPRMHVYVRKAIGQRLTVQVQRLDLNTTPVCGAQTFQVPRPGCCQILRKQVVVSHGWLPCL